MNPKDQTQETVETSAYNPFPEPQTIPSGWDLSEMMCMPQSDFQRDTDMPAEGDSVKDR